MQTTAVAAHEFGTIARWKRIVTFQMTDKGKAVVTSEIERRVTENMQELRAELAETDFGARCKIALKVKEKFCWKAEETRQRIVRTGR